MQQFILHGCLYPIASAYAKLDFFKLPEWTRLSQGYMIYTQQTHNVAAASRRCSDVVVTLCVCWVKIGLGNKEYIKEQISEYRFYLDFSYDNSVVCIAT